MEKSKNRKVDKHVVKEKEEYISTSPVPVPVVPTANQKCIKI